MKMNPLLAPVTRALDALIAAAKPYQSLFPSLLDRKTGALLAALPPAIPGQRDWDRAHLGSNLIHDEATLKTLYALAAASGRPDYAEAADLYLQRFATHCTDTATGLFPWGEHSFWHLVEDRVGNSYALTIDRPMTESAIQDHLRQAPASTSAASSPRRMTSKKASSQAFRAATTTPSPRSCRSGAASTASGRRRMSR